MKEEEDVQNEEKQEVSSKEESNELAERLETQSVASSGIIYRSEKKETSKAHGGEFIDLSNLRNKEHKKIKKEFQQTQEKTINRKHKSSLKISTAKSIGR